MSGYVCTRTVLYVRVCIIQMQTQSFRWSIRVCTGTFAIISIMVSGPVVGLANAPPACVTTRSNPDSDTGLAYEVDGRTFNDGLSFRIAIATSLALLIGLLQVQLQVLEIVSLEIEWSNIKFVNIKSEIKLKWLSSSIHQLLERTLGLSSVAGGGERW